MSIRQYLIDQHSPLVVDGKQYISFRSIISRFKMQRGKAKTTNKQFVETHELEYIITNNRDEVVDVNMNEYHHTRNQILVSIDSLLTTIDLLPLITDEYNESLADIITNQPVAEREIQVIPSSAPMSDLTQFDLLKLDNHEMLLDHNYDPVDIEMRGTRSGKGIFIRAEHIGTYLDLNSLIETIQDPIHLYMEGKHWIKLYWYGHDVYGTSLIGYNPESIASEIYLTLEGLLKLVFCATSISENLDHLRSWIVDLVFGHKFGSKDERLGLLDSLMPYEVREQKVSGIYLMRIGSVGHLRESMGIPDDIYNNHKYGLSSVFKYGISDDIFDQYNQHCDEYYGYGRYSNRITMEWFVEIQSHRSEHIEKHMIDGFFDEYQQLTFEDDNRVFIANEYSGCRPNNKYIEVAHTLGEAINSLREKVYKISFVRNDRTRINLSRRERALLTDENNVQMLQINIHRLEETNRHRKETIHQLKETNHQLKETNHQLEAHIAEIKNLYEAKLAEINTKLEQASLK
jgi:hypothetical protein